MQLHEKKICSIYDDLTKIIPTTHIVNDFDAPLKLIHLLEHTSGLADLSFGELAASCLFYSSAEACEKIKKQNKLRWKPGEFMSYTNWGIVYLAEAISVQTRMANEEYMRRNLFDPVGDG